MSENRETCGLSIASLVTGILGVFPVAIICGHLSLRNIRKNNLGGKGLALAGTILGYVYLGLTMLMLIPAVIFFSFLQMTPVTTDYGEEPVVVQEVEWTNSEEVIEEIEEIEE